MKNFLAEFKEFANRGNVLGLAVGVMIGGAFQKVVTGFIDYIFSPILGILPGKSMNSWGFDINGVHIAIGAFLSVLIDFVVMALVIFLIVKGVNALMSLRKKEETPAATKICPYCRTEIDIYAVRCPHCTSVLEQPAAPVQE